MSPLPTRRAEAQTPPTEDLDWRGLITAIEEEFPRFRIVAKRGNTLSHAIDRALRLLTFGGQQRYISHYHTVLGYTLYVPDSWEDTEAVDRAILLCHERVHLRQRRRLGFLSMAFLYLIPLFPLGLAYGRARLEWEAYAETLAATARYRGIAAARSPQLRDQIVRRFTGPDYAWMWPFPNQVNSWYDEVLIGLDESS
ncbi:MAG: hypothetical protein HRU17_02110 [Polyangiaceae bacterium]|nr:hypothetical protein [Polyangiaceae bacterium]